MRIVRKLSDLEIHGNDASQAPVLVGVVFLIIALGFWITGEGPLTLLRMGTLAALAGTAAAFIWLARGKSRRISIHHSPPSIESHDGVVSASPGSILRLTDAPGAYPTGPARYGVELSTRDGGRTLLFADDDPAVVIESTALIASTLGLPVSSGWGLRPGAPWTTLGEDVPMSSSSSRAVDQDPSDPRKLALIIGAGSIAAALILGFEIRGRIALGETPSTLAIVLPILLVAMLTVLALFIATHRETLVMGVDLRFERRLFGVVVHREIVPSSALRGAYLVGPQGLTRHLLVDTTDGPRAFPVEELRGREIVALIEASLRAATPAS